MNLLSFIKTNYTHYSGIKKINKTDNCYYVEPDENFCMNVNREHSSSGVYFQIKLTGICQRCYCKKGTCINFASKELPLNNILSKLLFGESSKSNLEVKGKGKKPKTLVTYNVKINSTYYNNCISILNQISNELKIT